MLLKFAKVASVLLLCSKLGAQTMRVPSADSTRTALTASRKSPWTAGLVGLVLPGVGHLYAGERGRGIVLQVIYWTGAVMTARGRHDDVGHVGGVLVVSSILVGSIDGYRSAGRHNARLAVAVSALPAASNVQVRVTW